MYSANVAGNLCFVRLICYCSAADHIPTMEVDVASVVIIKAIEMCVALSTVVNEGCRVVAEGIVDKPADLDVASVMAMGFPAVRVRLTRQVTSGST